MIDDFADIGPRRAILLAGGEAALRQRCDGLLVSHTADIRHRGRADRYRRAERLEEQIERQHHREHREQSEDRAAVVKRLPLARETRKRRDDRRIAIARGSDERVGERPRARIAVHRIWIERARHREIDSR